MSKNQPLTKEELEEILKAHNLDFSDIAKIANTINTSSNEEIEEKTEVIKSPKKKTTEPTYEITKISYPDFVITKKTVSQTKELAIAPSCEGMFIRTLKKNGSWEVEQLNGENYASFMADVPEEKLLTLPEEFYITKLERGKVFGASLVIYLSDETIRKMIKDKCAPKFNKSQYTKTFYGVNSENIAKQRDIYRVFPIIYKEYANSENEKIKNIIKTSPGLLMFVYKIYGLDKARDFVKHMDLCMYELGKQGWNYGYYNRGAYCDQEIKNKLMGTEDNIVNTTVQFYLPDNLPIIKMDYETFKEYLLYESYRLGYSNIDEFLLTWSDTLSMQHEFFGKIKEKYPKDLLVYHNKLCRRKNNYKYYTDVIFKANFEKAAKKNINFVWKPQNSEYEYIVPLNTEDVAQEAEQQSNCLVHAKYMQRVIDGTSILVFMRRKEDVEHSFVTMEICQDPNNHIYKINQAYLASNQTPSETVRTEIKKYAEHFNLVYED